LNILGKPSAKRTKIEKPLNGKATDYLVKFLAGEFGVKVSDIEVVFRRKNVNKQLRIKNPKKLLSVFK
jgi:uncharacterized protein YggU (UPF0235/DUF167 family)